jgi:hypothetical protein
MLVADGEGARATRRSHRRAPTCCSGCDRDLSNALRNAATSTAIATDKALAARERPVAMPQSKRDIGEIVRSLEALGVARQVELPGAQPVEAEVVDETHPVERR